MLILIPICSFFSYLIVSLALFWSSTALDDNAAIVPTSGSGFVPAIGTDSEVTQESEFVTLRSRCTCVWEGGPVDCRTSLRVCRMVWIRSSTQFFFMRSFYIGSRARDVDRSILIHVLLSLRIQRTVFRWDVSRSKDGVSCLMLFGVPLMPRVDSGGFGTLIGTVESFRAAKIGAVPEFKSRTRPAFG